MVYLFLAEGFEEIEALTVVDILRRADQEVTTVGVGGNVVTGAHGLTVIADVAESRSAFVGCGNGCIAGRTTGHNESGKERDRSAARWKPPRSKARFWRRSARLPRFLRIGVC